MMNKIWYQRRLPVYLWPLLPFSWLYLGMTTLRRKFYQWGIFHSEKVPMPVIVVGNVTVGGTGKTPLVIHIYELLKRRGLRPGIVSRGYKGKEKGPIWVNHQSRPEDVGDEPVLFFRKLGCPVVVSHKRIEAVRQLLDSGQVNIILSDDGLQHYGLARDLEIAVLDGERQFGNRQGLPLGPLRESINRFNTVDLKVVNGLSLKGAYDMELKFQAVQNGMQPNFCQELSVFDNQSVHAVAGIGHPERFFQMLRDHNITVIPHAFPDHYFFRPEDIEFEDNLPVIMTEKDAVKCKKFMTDNHWVLPVRSVLNPLFDARLVTLLQEIMDG